MAGPPHITHAYLICSTPRSGSNWLCEVLSSIGYAGRPEEYFWNPPFWRERWGVRDFPSFFARLVREGTTPNGVFGSKLMREQHKPLIRQLASLFEMRDRTEAEVLAGAFPGLRFVWLTRRDKVRQGISFHRALQTKRWRSTDVGTGPTDEAEFDFDAIRGLIELCLDEETEWQAFFDAHKLDPLVVQYEDLVECLETQVQRILAHVGIEPPGPLELERKWRHVRQGDATTEEWVQRYLAQRVCGDSYQTVGPCST